MNLGHRKRIVTRYLKYPWLFGQIDILEILLFYCIPRKDTRPMAIAIIKKYKNIHNAMDNLRPLDIDGLGEKSCMFLKILLEIINNINQPYVYKKIKCDTKTIVKTCQMQLYWQNKESIIAFFLRSDHTFIKKEVINSGNDQSVAFPIHVLIHKCLSNQASIVILCHNHPSGNCNPSANDIKYTYNTRQHLKNLGILLWDHIIIASNKYFSMRENKLFD